MALQVGALEALGSKVYHVARHLAGHCLPHQHLSSFKLELQPLPLLLLPGRRRRYCIKVLGLVALALGLAKGHHFPHHVTRHLEKHRSFPHHRLASLELHPLLLFQPYSTGLGLRPRHLPPREWPSPLALEGVSSLAKTIPSLTSIEPCLPLPSQSHRPRSLPGAWPGTRRRRSPRR